MDMSCTFVEPSRALCRIGPRRVNYVNSLMWGSWSSRTSCVSTGDDFEYGYFISDYTPVERARTHLYLHL